MGTEGQRALHGTFVPDYEVERSPAVHRELQVKDESWFAL